jgi:hypothetical protein
MFIFAPDEGVMSCMPNVLTPSGCRENSCPEGAETDEQ